MEKERYDSLVKDLGQSIVDQLVNKLNEYADMKPKKFKEYGCHAAVIRNWHRRNQEEKPKISNSFENENKELLKKIMKKFPEKFKNGEIADGHDYIEFRRGHYVERYKFSDLGFKECVLNSLRKMNLNIEDLK